MTLHLMVADTTLEHGRTGAGARFVVSFAGERALGRDSSAEHDRRSIGPIEFELTMHLERAHELSERAKASNDIVQREISRACDIARALHDEFGDPHERGTDRFR